MTRHALIPPALAILRPPSLDALAAGYVRQPVTATNAELALAELARNTRTPERVRAWDAARAAWAGLSDDERRGIIGDVATTERASARGAETPSGALGSPPEVAGGKHD